MAKLKKYWLKTAKSFVLAADDLVVAVVETAKAGRDKVIEWAEAENINVEAQGTEIPTEEAVEAPAEETAAEEAPAETPAEEAPAEAPAEPVAEAAPEAPVEEKPKKSKK